MRFFSIKNTFGKIMSIRFHLMMMWIHRNRNVRCRLSKLKQRSFIIIIFMKWRRNKKKEETFDKSILLEPSNVMPVHCLCKKFNFSKTRFRGRDNCKARHVPFWYSGKRTSIYIRITCHHFLLSHAYSKHRLRLVKTLTFQLWWNRF